MGDTGDNGGQTPATRGDGRRLTYAQIASRLGISGDAARILVRRRGWTRIMPNRHGAPAVIIVPDEALDAEDWRRVGGDTPDTDREDTGDETATDPDNVADVRVVKAEQRATEAERRADEANQRADAAVAVADRAMAQLADAGERTERLARDLAAALSAADHARGEASTARQAAAEQQLAAEQARAELTASQEAARRAEEAASALQQADKARKGRGRLRRAWDGWRGR